MIHLQDALYKENAKGHPSPGCSGLGTTPAQAQHNTRFISTGAFLSSPSHGQVAASSHTAGHQRDMSAPARSKAHLLTSCRVWLPSPHKQGRPDPHPPRTVRVWSHCSLQSEGCWLQAHLPRLCFLSHSWPPEIFLVLLYVVLF